MVKLRSGFCTQAGLRPQGHVPCCQCRWRAVHVGHYECFKLCPPCEPDYSPAQESLLFLRAALLGGHVAFACCLFDELGLDAFCFAEHCLVEDDPVSLRFAIGADPGMDLVSLCREAAMYKFIECLRVLLENGAPWGPRNLLCATRDSRLDILELVLPHTREWWPQVPTLAACLGHVRFLMRIFDAGCPTWTSADDGEPEKVSGLWAIPRFYRVGLDVPLPLPGWCLVVSSDLVRSGPVLLYAAQKGAPLTPRMEGMLGDVRRRALALAGCFHRAAKVRRRPGMCARKWVAMGRVPVEIIERIATLAKLSIVSRDLVE